MQNTAIHSSFMESFRLCSVCVCVCVCVCEILNSVHEASQCVYLFRCGGLLDLWLCVYVHTCQLLYVRLPRCVTAGVCMSRYSGVRCVWPVKCPLSKQPVFVCGNRAQNPDYRWLKLYALSSLSLFKPLCTAVTLHLLCKHMKARFSTCELTKNFKEDILCKFSDSHLYLVPFLWHLYML